MCPHKLLLNISILIKGILEDITIFLASEQVFILENMYT